MRSSLSYDRNLANVSDQQAFYGRTPIVQSLNRADILRRNSGTPGPESIPP